MAKIIGATSIDTGSSSLKSVDGNYLKDGDLSLVLSENGVFFYKLHGGDGSSENIPYIVKPSENAASKRWRMLSITELSEDIRLQKDNSFQLTNIKLGEENEIDIYDYSDNEIGKITDNQFIFNNSLQLSDIYTDRINDWDTNKVILSDGTRSFTSPVISPDPEYAGHLTNKDYVDSETTAISADFQSYKDYVDDNFAKWDNTESHTPSHDYNPSTKKYTDDTVNSIYTELSFSVSSSGGNVVEYNPTDISFEDNIQASSTGENSVIITVPNDLTEIANYDTDDLDEGTSNLYYTDERVDDRVNNLLESSDSIDFTYNDSENTLTIDTVDSNIDHDVLTNYITNEHIDWTVDQGATNINDNNIQQSAITQYSYTQSDLGISGLLSIDGVSNQDGDVDLVNGGNVTITPDDTANSITISVPNDLTVMSNYDTDDLNEGTDNLYFTTSRIDSHLTGGEGIAYSTGTIDLDIDSLSTEISASPSGDYLCFYDSNAGSHKNITPSDLIESIDIVYTSVSDDGSQIVANASDINFGTNINVTDDNDDTVTVAVPNDLTVISNYDTDDLSEGTGNLYFTTTRVDNHLSGGTGINYSTGTVSIDSTVTQNGDTDVSGNSWVLDEDSFVSNSNTKVPTQQSVKSYVDAVEQGLDLKDSVRAATDGLNIDLISTSDPNPIDGVTLSNDDRVLLKDQTTASENGIYDAVTATDPTSWVRSDDADEDSEVNAGMFTFVEEGTSNNNRGFVLTTNDSITVGTTDLSFTQFSGAGQITAGDGLVKSGDTLNIELDIENSGTDVNTGYGLNFNSNINVSDDGDETFTIDVPNDLTVMSNYSISDLNDSALPNATAAGQVQIWNATNGQFENSVLTNNGNVTITNGDASIDLSVPNDLTVMSNYDTDNLNEGTGNLYFTNTRVDNHLSGGEGILYSTGAIDLDIDSLSTETSASSLDDYICFYDSSAGSHKNITPDDLIGTVGEYASVSDNGTTVVSNASDINFSDNLAVTDDQDGTVTVMGEGGISKLEKRPDNFMLDDENTDVSRSSYWGMTDTLSFGPSGSGAGSVWLNFIIPDSFDISKDININLFYTLSGVDDGKTVEIETESWSTSTGSQPASASEGIFSDTITSGTTNTDNLTKWQLSNGVIPASAIDSIDDLITVKFTRPIIDDYSGSFALISALFYQS